MSPDPVDVISLIMDTVTVELGNKDFTTRSAPGVTMDRAASPRPLSETGGVAQEYMSFFYTNGGTLADPAMIPVPDSMRAMADFFNSLSLGGIGPSGADPHTIESIAIDRMSVPVN